MILQGIATILLLLTSVVASSVVARVLRRRVPLPLIQIAIGATLAVSTGFSVTIDPELFLLLFITPLLFLDGWRIPKDRIVAFKWTVFSLAFGLVFFTVIAAGFFIHWMIPAMPLSVAFALAAVISPTDAVAVSSMSTQTLVPARLMHVLEGESLLNDASGLVCLRFAVVATVTGEFSLVAAAENFLWTAVAGATIGAAVAGVANLMKDSIARYFDEETGSQILISILMPFGAYLGASAVNASGILAAVAAGIVMYYEERSGRASAATRVRRAAVWDAIQFAVNGVVFIVLGGQLPGIVGSADSVVKEASHTNVWWLVAYIVAIVLVVGVIRGLWAWLTLKLVALRSRSGRNELQMPAWYVVCVTSLAGVRGALTLSAVMALPLRLENGSLFPARDLVIALAAGVIIASLVIANLGLPVVTRIAGQLPEHASGEEEMNAMRIAAAQAALRAVRDHGDKSAVNPAAANLHAKAAMRIVAEYQERIEVHAQSQTDTELARSTDSFERSLRLIGVAAERAAYLRVARTGTLSDVAIGALVRELDLIESRLRAC